jgi:hypothetical protein
MGASAAPAANPRTTAALAALAYPVHRAIADRGDPAAAYADRIGALFHLADVAAADDSGAEMVACLQRMLLDKALGSRRQDLFLARKAAEVLLHLTSSARPCLAREAWSALNRTLRRTTGLAHRGAAETIGALPCLGRKAARRLPFTRCGRRPIRWAEILARAGMGPPVRLEVQGRSLLARNGRAGPVLVVKQARAAQDPDDLAREAAWMTWLVETAPGFDCRFAVPEPLAFDGAHLVRVEGLPAPGPPNPELHPERWAICYLALESYFVYPNDPRPALRPPPEAFVEIMGRAARLLGALAGIGIVHEAPIPLFHNRVQRHRRRDAGRYEWFRGGRLDRWLASCAYPNWGPDGLRDFEHLVEFDGPPLHLYRHLGNHFLSLLLVAGSYFRVQDPGRAGRRSDGDPVDARDLFDPDLLGRTIVAIFEGYYRGFVGTGASEKPPLEPQGLAARMIEEMGVDRHMEEVLRAADQRAMSRDAFQSFLSRRGFSARQIAALRRGEQDLTVLTGPHLGGFNQTISLPELVTAVEGMAAACIAGRHRRGGHCCPDNRGFTIG